MKLLSLNIHGLGGLTKIKSFGSLLSEIKLDMVFLQEKMRDHSQALLSFSKVKPGWEFCARDSHGLCGGILTGWDPSMVHCKFFVSLFGILVKVLLRNQSLDLTCLNFYGPYHNRAVF